MSMYRPAKGGFYAVKQGRTIGVFMSWEECQAEIKDYRGAVYKKFSDAAAAEDFVNGTSTPFAKSDATDGERVTDNMAFVDNGKKRARSSDVEDENEWDVVYCDGACKGNGQPGSVAGIGVWWGENDPRNLAERCPGSQTNNRAELIAILRILETTPVTTKPMLIKSDSKYSINCIKLWLRKWRANGFRTSDGGPVKNAPLIRYIAANLESRAKMSQKIQLQHVKGHDGEKGNEGADGLAAMGAMMPALPERDWEEHLRELEARLSVEACTAKVVPKEVGEDAVEFKMVKSKPADPRGTTTEFHPMKMVKTNPLDPIVEPSSMPISKSKAYPPKVVVRPEEVNLETYASEKMRDEPVVVEMKQPNRTDCSKERMRWLVAESNGVSYSVPEEDVDPDMYADALLSDEELRDLKF